MTAEQLSALLDETDRVRRRWRQIEDLANDTEDTRLIALIEMTRWTVLDVRDHLQRVLEDEVAA